MSCGMSSAGVPRLVFRFPGCVRQRNLQATQVSSLQPLVSSLVGTRNVTFVATQSPTSTTQSYYLLKIQKGGQVPNCKTPWTLAIHCCMGQVSFCSAQMCTCSLYPSSRGKDDLALVSCVPCRRHSYEVSAPQRGQSSPCEARPQ